jgi:hypothetical protein
MAKMSLLLCLVTIAAGCGGTTKRDVSQPGKSFAAALDYSRCMRSHGVAGFPDPKQVGDSIQISGARSGTSPASRSFVAAQQNCRHLLPDGGQTTHAGQQRGLARMLRSSQCMRAHGISGFPDPTLSPPSNRAGYSDIMSNGVAWLAIPASIDVRSPSFERAATACNLGLS